MGGPKTYTTPPPDEKGVEQDPEAPAVVTTPDVDKPAEDAGKDEGEGEE